VVVANILASILIPLRDALLARAKPGAVILLSGILAKQADEVVQHYQAAGATLLEQRVQAAWTALLLRAP
jgi:ribosomal protein L11 methyltransferase